MLWLNPELVTLALAGAPSLTLDGVRSISINRSAARLALEFTDLGPHVGFADAPEQRVDIVIERNVSPETAAPSAALAPGALGALSFRAAAANSDRAGRLISAQAVVTRVRHDHSRSLGWLQTIALVAISDDGASDPILVSAEEEN